MPHLTENAFLDNGYHSYRYDHSSSDGLPWGVDRSLSQPRTTANQTDLVLEAHHRWADACPVSREADSIAEEVRLASVEGRFEGIVDWQVSVAAADNKCTGLLHTVLHSSSIVGAHGHEVCTVLGEIQNEDGQSVLFDGHGAYVFREGVACLRLFEKSSDATPSNFEILLSPAAYNAEWTKALELVYCNLPYDRIMKESLLLRMAMREMFSELVSAGMNHEDVVSIEIAEANSAYPLVARTLLGSYFLGLVHDSFSCRLIVSVLPIDNE